MSSLLQFTGSMSDKGVGLQFVKLSGVNYMDSIRDKTLDYGADMYDCKRCNRRHSLIAVAYRKPVDMLGCWVRFRYLGKLQVPDLSCPIDVDEYPRGARLLSESDSTDIWHSD